MAIALRGCLHSVIRESDHDSREAQPTHHEMGQLRRPWWSTQQVFLGEPNRLIRKQVDVDHQGWWYQTNWVARASCNGDL